MNTVEIMFLVIVLITVILLVLRSVRKDKKKNAHLASDGVNGSDVLCPHLPGEKEYDVLKNEKLIIVQTVVYDGETHLIENNSPQSVFHVVGNKVVWIDNPLGVCCTVNVVLS